MFDVAVIGGGAAGLAASVCAAWAKKRAGSSARVAIFEANDRVGRSILATGNGRCNFSNANISADVYRNAPFVAQVFAALEEVVFWEPACAQQPEDVPAASGVSCPANAVNGAQHAGAEACVNGPQENMQATRTPNAVLGLFASMGLAWRHEAQGRLFPLTGKASTVVDVLRHAARELGVTEHCSMRVECVCPPRGSGEPYVIRCAHGETHHACTVICAGGGAVAKQILPEGLLYVPPRPVLGALNTETHAIAGLNNIRVRCAASLMREHAVLAREEGEVLFRNYGVSGIAIFNLSRFACTGDVVSLNFLPHATTEQIQDMLHHRARMHETLSGDAATCEDVLRGLLVPLLARAVLKSQNLAPESPADSENIACVAHALQHFKLVVRGVADAKHCQVHAGGFSCVNINPLTMEFRAFPGLFAAGEMLDVDAPCGGYNLHWAWASGALAGVSAAQGQVCR